MNTDTKLMEVKVSPRQLTTISIEAIKNVPAPVAKGRQQSLIHLGQVDPVRVRLDDDGLYIITDGRRRVANMLAAGISEVEVIVEEIGETQAALHALALNMSRSHSPMTEAKLIAKLVDKGHTQQQIAEMLGVTQGVVSQRLGLLDLIPELQQRLEVGEMTMTAARAARKLPKKDQAELAKLDKVTVKSADEILRGYQAAMVDLSVIDIPDLPQPANHTITLTDDQVSELESGQPVTIEINGKQCQIITT